jgi:ubiquinone biosynthesis protein UbiJ
MTQRAHRDWEEDLAKLVGDPLAFQIGYRIRDAKAHFAQLSSQHQHDIHQMLSEYIRYEWSLVPSQTELSAHGQAVCELESRVAALETRLNTLVNAPDQV